MATQYSVDPDQLDSLAQAYDKAAQDLAGVAKKIASILGQFQQSEIDTLIMGGLISEGLMLEARATVEQAGSSAANLGTQLSQDGRSLHQSALRYRQAEEQAARRLKEVHNKGPVPTPPTLGAGGGFARGSSGQGGGSSGGSSAGTGSGAARPAHYANRAQVTEWINQAFQILQAHGVPASDLNVEGVLTIIEHESGGNPNAINNWDINAQHGDPSRGLMQTIGTTYDAYKIPGHNDIYNPVDNIVAGVRYALSRYGSISNVPGVKRVNEGQSYVGY